jgi:hypothetical protein
MTNEDAEANIISDAQRIVGARFTVEKVEQRWKPHHYVVTTEVQNWLQKHCHSITSPDNIATAERMLDKACAKCGDRFYMHEVRTILILRLRANTGFHFAWSRLNALAACIKTNNLDGYELIEDGFKILPRKIKPDAKKRKNNNG